MKQYKPRRKVSIFPPDQDGEMSGIRVQLRLSKNQIWKYAGTMKDGRTRLKRGQVDILLTAAPLNWLFKEVGVKKGKTLLGENND